MAFEGIREMFTPPRCPNSICPRYSKPGSEPFFIRRGYYQPKCRTHPVPRFQCRTCRKRFSRQTFRADYRDQKPHTNAMVFALLSSGLGLRQTGRVVGLSRPGITAKFCKIAHHLRRLNENLRGQLGETATLQFDELETYEGRRNTRPLTLPILIDCESRFHIAARSAAIRPRGKMTEARKRAIEDDEERLGRRLDRSRDAIRSVLRAGARLCKDAKRIILQTDEKGVYPNLAKEAFGAERLEHETTNSKLARLTWNPLFPINHTEAMARDLTGRLRRESWLVSKKSAYLNLHLQMLMAYRNYVRPRFNYDHETPAQILGFVAERMTPWDMSTWRQDWGEKSIHPLERGPFRSIAEVRAAAA